MQAVRWCSESLDSECDLLQVKLAREILIVTMAAMCYSFIEYAMLNGRLSDDLTYVLDPWRFQAVSDIGHRTSETVECFIYPWKVLFFFFKFSSVHLHCLCSPIFTIQYVFHNTECDLQNIIFYKISTANYSSFAGRFSCNQEFFLVQPSCC